MRVLFTFGGLPHYYNFVLNRLNEIKGVEIHVLIPDKKSDIIGKGVFQSESGIKFKVYKLPERKTWYGREFFTGFTRLISEVKPDIVVATWPYILGFVFLPFVLLQLKLNRIKLILKEIPFGIPKRKEALKFYSEENLYSESTGKIRYNTSLLSMIKIHLLGYVRLIIFNFVDAHVNYASSAFEIFESYGVKKEKIFITYNSPDTSRLFNAKKELESDNIPFNNHRLIHIGRLVKWKRVDLLISAMAELKSVFADIELIIIGEGPEKDSLQEQVKEMGLADSVFFVGSKYEPLETGRYLLSSSVYVLAGMGGLSINEAMSFGKPVICSVCDGTEKELVKDGYNGYFFKEGDREDLAEKIKILLKNPELVKRMGENSFDIIKNKININSVLDGYQKAFNYVYNK